MAKHFTRDELINGIVKGEDGSLQLSFEDATALAKILIRNGYAVMFTGGAIGDKVRVDWLYAGDTEALDYAHREDVCFGHHDFLEMLEMGDYKDEDGEEN